MAIKSIEEIKNIEKEYREKFYELTVQINGIRDEIENMRRNIQKTVGVYGVRSRIFDNLYENSRKLTWEDHENFIELFEVAKELYDLWMSKDIAE